MARLFDYDPVTKTKQLFHWNESDESGYIETLQDVTDIVEANKGIFNLYDERTGWKGDQHLVGRIPLPLYFQLKQEGAIDPNGDCADPRLLKWLGNSENKAWRTRPGKLI